MLTSNSINRPCCPKVFIRNILIYYLHSWTRTARLTHGHRILCLAEDFEILRLTPDFETLCLAGAWRASNAMFWNLAPDPWFQNIASGWRLAGIWLASVWRLMPHFKKLRLAGIWQASGGRLTGVWRNVLKSHVRHNVSKSGVRHKISKSSARRKYSVTMRQTCIMSGIV